MPSQVNPWHPISTAPQDGSWILLCGGSVNYGWELGCSKPPAVVAQWVQLAKGAGSWQFSWYGGGYYGDYESPTLWMAVPGAAIG